MKQGIKELPTEFIWKGEVKGFHFSQLMRGEKMFLYEVYFDGLTYYEVFEYRVCFTPKTKEPYEGYPKANSFGVWAWTYRDFEKAVEKFNKMENNETF